MVYVSREIAVGMRCCERPDRMCLGDDCMAWRWRDRLSKAEESPSVGYCGYVAKPTWNWVLEENDGDNDEVITVVDNVIYLNESGGE